MKTQTSATKTRANVWQVRAVFAIAFIAVMGAFGLFWRSQIYWQGVEIRGARYANSDSLRERVEVDTTLLFYDVVPHVIAQRVSQDPWVESADVLRQARAVLGVHVRERVPAMLVLDDRGRPDRFLDADGYQMPYHPQALFDIPLITGLNEPYAPSPIQNAVVKRLLIDLQHVPVEVDALLSTFHLESNGDITLHTIPRPGRGSIPVRLGKKHFDQKLSKLYTFWHRTVLLKQDSNFESIDLRFDSQIITKEVRLSQ